MSALITIQNLAAQTPDGRSLFQNFSLNLSRERTGLIGRNGVGKSTLLHMIAGDVTPLSGILWSHARLGVLHQIIGAHHATIADLFGVKDQLATLQMLISGISADDKQLANGWMEADWTLETRIDEALEKMGLHGILPSQAITGLSGGQRTRAAFAALLFQEPDFILLDEPTNNLDADGRKAVSDFLRQWRGGALVVSHDRGLLREMDRIVDMTSVGISVYGGNWDFYEQRKAEELSAAAHDLDVAETAVRQAEKQARITRERQEKRDASGKKSRDKAGMSKLLLDAREDRAQKTGGRNQLLAQKQADAGRSALTEAQSRIERLTPHDFAIASVGLPATKIVLSTQDVTFGFAGKPPLFTDLSLQITGAERIALVGSNGTGKSTLLRVLAGLQSVQQGSVQCHVSHAMLDQDVTLLDDTMSIADNFKRLNPNSTDNICRAALARFMFRADSALQKTGSLSGGERLRAGLACILGSSTPPQLLILDEPTNHLDIVALKAVEGALNAYDGALLITSHDEDFLEAIGISRRIKL